MLRSKVVADVEGEDDGAVIGEGEEAAVKVVDGTDDEEDDGDDGDADDEEQDDMSMMMMMKKKLQRYKKSWEVRTLLRWEANRIDSVSNRFVNFHERIEVQET